MPVSRARYCKTASRVAASCAVLNTAIYLTEMFPALDPAAPAGLERSVDQVLCLLQRGGRGGRQVVDRPGEPLAGAGGACMAAIAFSCSICWSAAIA